MPPFGRLKPLLAAVVTVFVIVLLLKNYGIYELAKSYR